MGKSGCAGPEIPHLCAVTTSWLRACTALWRHLPVAVGNTNPLSYNHRIMEYWGGRDPQESNPTLTLPSPRSPSPFPFGSLLAGILPGPRGTRGAQGSHSYQGTFHLYFTFMWSTVSGTWCLVRAAIEDNSQSQYRARNRLDLTCLLSLHSYIFTNRFLSFRWFWNNFPKKLNGLSRNYLNRFFVLPFLFPPALTTKMWEW